MQIRFILIAIFFCPLFLTGQLTIGESGNTSIGASVSSTIRFRVLSRDLPYGFLLDTHGQGYDNPITGILNRLDLGNGKKYGLKNEIKQPLSSSGEAFGMHNKIFNSGAGRSYGIFNQIDASGLGEKRGVYNQVSDDNSNFPNSTLPMFGVYNFMVSRYRPIVYGNYTKLHSYSDNSSDKVYGSYIFKSNPSSNVKMTGLYVDMEGPNNYAAILKGEVNVIGNTDFSGDVVVNGAMVMTSDKTLKDRAQPIIDALGIVQQLIPRTYHFKKGNRFNYDPEIQHFGFYAQDVEEVIPSVVESVHHAEISMHHEVKYTKEELAEMPDRGSDEASIKDMKEVILYPAETLKGIRYIDLIPLLAQAIKEQQKLIKQQNEALKALTRKVEQIDEMQEEFLALRKLLSKKEN